MQHPWAPTRVALIGYGYVGKTFHAPLLRATGGFELALIVSSDAAKVRVDLPHIAVTAEPHVAIDDANIDLIVIASPNETHAPLARAALEAGKHVVVDKPFTVTVAEARELSQLAAKCRRVLSVFQNRRWDSDFLGVKHVIAQDLLGDVMHFESHVDRFRPHVRARWREQAVPGGGIWYDLGPHLIDQSLCLFGLPERVQANLATQRHGAETTDWAHVVLEYGARRVILHAGMLVAGGSARFTVHGSKGSLIKQFPDEQEAQLKAGMPPGAQGWGADSDDMLFYDADGKVSHMATPAGDQRQYYAQLRAALIGAGANPVTPLQALSVMRVLEAAIESSATGLTAALTWSAAERTAWQALS